MDDCRPLDKVSQFYAFQGGPVNRSISPEIHVRDNGAARSSRAYCFLQRHHFQVTLLGQSKEELREPLSPFFNISTQSTGQFERKIQTLENMLRACVLNLGGSWEDHLYMVESPTTTVIKQVSRWHHFKLYTIGDSPCVGMMLDNIAY